MNNLWNDDLTQSIASTVSDVLEGKIKVEEMNPKDLDNEFKKNE